MARERRRPFRSDSEKDSGLRSFIMRRFVLISGAIAVVELAVSSFLNGIMFPLLVLIMEGESGSAGVWDVLRLVVSAAADALSGGHHVLSAMAGISLVFVLLFACLVLMAVPVVLGAFAFALLIQQRISEEQAAREEERRRFYERRNLMISDMAHDLRTPAMTIGGLSQAIAEGLVKDPEDQKRHLNSIGAKASRISELVNLLFDFVKLESEGYELHRGCIDLSQLALNEAAAVYADAEAAGMSLAVEVPEERVPVFADEQQLARVVANLLANALRHNQEGCELLVALVRKAGAAEVVVADSGEPIEGDASALFEPFARGDASRSGEGSGLGLAIVSRIVEMHGFDIRLEQPYGRFSKAFVMSCVLADDEEKA